MIETRNILFLCILAITAIGAHAISSVELLALSADRVKCQSIYFADLTTALVFYPKAEIDFNKYYNNGTCQIQCLLKTGSKNFQALAQITAADFMPCKLGNAAMSKIKTYCFNGKCLTPAQINPLVIMATR